MHWNRHQRCELLNFGIHPSTFYRGSLIPAARAPPSLGGTRCARSDTTRTPLLFPVGESLRCINLLCFDERYSHFPVSCPYRIRLASLPSRPSFARRPCLAISVHSVLTDQRPRVRLEAGNSDPSALRCGGDRRCPFVGSRHVAACSARWHAIKTLNGRELSCVPFLLFQLNCVHASSYCVPPLAYRWKQPCEMDSKNDCLNHCKQPPNLARPIASQNNCYEDSRDNQSAD